MSSIISKDPNVGPEPGAEALRVCLGSVDEMLRARRSAEAPPSTLWCAALADRLARLYDALQAVGLRELGGGQTPPSRAADAAKVTSDLRIQRKVVLSELRVILDHLWWADWPSVWPEVLERLRRVMKTLRATERTATPPSSRLRRAG